MVIEYQLARTSPARVPDGMWRRGRREKREHDRAISAVSDGCSRRALATQTMSLVGLKDIR